MIPTSSETVSAARTRRRRKPRINDSGKGYRAVMRSGRARKDQRGIGTAKAEGIRERIGHFALLGVFWHQIDVAGGRRVVEVERRRNDLIADRKDREDRLDATGRAEQMPNRGFRRRHRQFIRMSAKKPLHRTELDLVAERGGGTVGVNVVDLLRSDTGPPQRIAHRSKSTVAVLGRRRKMKGIARHAITDHLGVDLRPPPLGMLILFENEDPRDWAYNEPLTVLIPGTRSTRRYIAEPGR